MIEDDTIAVEKLNGTNVKLLTEDGRLTSLYNRKNSIDPLQIMKGKTFIIEGIFRAIQKGYVEKDGEQAGEVIGPKVQGNPYNLNNHIWYPFSKAVKHLSYRSFHEHEKNFDNWSRWFKDYLVSRFSAKRKSKYTHYSEVMAEGIVLYNLRRKEEGKIYRSKLRRDMFGWYYSDVIEIGCGSIGSRTKAINIGSLSDLQAKFLRFFARITIQEKDTSGFSRSWTVER